MVLLLLVLTFGLASSAQETDLIDDMLQDVVRPDGVQKGNKLSLVDFDPNSFRELILSPFHDWHLVDVTFRQEMIGLIKTNEAKVLHLLNSDDETEIRLGLGLTARGPDLPELRKSTFRIFANKGLSESLRLDAFRVCCVFSPSKAEVMPDAITDLPMIGECLKKCDGQLPNETLTVMAPICEMYGDILRNSGHSDAASINLARQIRDSESVGVRVTALAILGAIADDLDGANKILADVYQDKPIHEELKTQLLLAMALSTESNVEFENMLARLSVTESMAKYVTQVRSKFLDQREINYRNEAKQAESDLPRFTTFYRERLQINKPVIRRHVLKVLLHSQVLAGELRPEVSKYASEGEVRTKRLADRVLAALPKLEQSD